MKVIYLIITFLTSFSTMSYAMITASLVSDFTGEEILSQCLTMGPYLLGLGLGSYFGEKFTQDSLKALWKIEWASVIVLPLIPVLHISFIFLYLNLSPLGTSLDSGTGLKVILTASGTLAFLTGLLGGAQLPLIIELVQSKLKTEFILAVNYSGPLLAGPLVVYWNNHAYAASVQTGIVAMLQILGLSLLIFSSSKRTLKMVLLALPLILIININTWYPRMEYLTIKSSYIGSKLSSLSFTEVIKHLNFIEQYGSLERVRTPYQVIDFFTTQTHPEFMAPTNSTLYLNRKTQFDLYAIDTYHQSMSHAAVNLSKSKQNILILGAGDGLLLKELSKMKGIDKMTLVELDEGIINWSKTNPVIANLNEGILESKHPSHKIIIGDAISFLRRAPKGTQYDIVFIDFPFPNGHELAKLYSYEFYSLLKNVTSKDALIMMDLPIQRDLNNKLTTETKVILKTLKEAGFDNRLPFGPNMSFVAAKRGGEALRFDYKSFSSEIAVSTRMNLIRLIDEEEMLLTDKEVHLNTMFWPRGLE